MPLLSTHLLALPQELRDQIYEHLHQEISLNWKWKITGTRRVFFPMYIEKAPLLSVLLSCSRLHTQYLEMHFVKNLAVILVRVFEEEGNRNVCLEMRADKLMRHLISGKLTNYRVVGTSPEPLQYSIGIPRLLVLREDWYLLGRLSKRLGLCPVFAKLHSSLITILSGLKI
jgi:hypothetical protein